jgi:hypothetical protein
MNALFLASVEQILNWFVLKSWMCSMCLIIKVLPIWPIYSMGHSLYDSWYLPLLLRRYEVDNLYLHFSL